MVCVDLGKFSPLCTSIVPIMQECGGSATISELQGLNISDLFTDFSSSSLQTETNISNVQNCLRRQTPNDTHV
jgi:hypothetical protein